MLSFSDLRQQIIGIDNWLDTPFGRKRLVYADYTASGRSLQGIENYLISLQQNYANSHTEDDSTGRVTTHLLHQAEEIIKRSVNAGPDGRIILCGSGATAAIDRMQQLVGVKLPAASRSTIETLFAGFAGKELIEIFNDHCQESQPVVFVGPYEHHSNEVSWREGLATVVEVRLSPSGEIDLKHLEQLLQAPEYQGRLRIGSFSAASNVTGMRTPVYEIAELLHQHDALAFFDYAASAPYVSIDMNPAPVNGLDRSLDAIFISPHKFVGGPGSSGVLVFNRRCYHSELSPSVAGGGTVDYVGPTYHDFIEDIEARENAGTPPILQTFKAALAFQLKDEIGCERIESRELELTSRAMYRWSGNPSIEILGNPDPGKRVGIISFNIKGNGEQYLHPRFVTTLLDDLFAIQSRAGCSCAGPYGHALLGIDEEKAAEYRAVIAKGVCGIKPGWCRVGFHYLFDDAEADYIIDAVEFVAQYGHLFLPLYRFDSSTGLWMHKDAKKSLPQLSLHEALAAQPLEQEPASLQQRINHYGDNLNQAKALADGLAEKSPVESFQLDGEVGELQFFQLTKESVPGVSC